MAASEVNPKHRKVTDKHTKPKFDADFTSNVEDDPAWQALHKPLKIINYIPPEKLEELIEEEMIGDLLECNKPQPSTPTTKNTSKNSKPTT